MIGVIFFLLLISVGVSAEAAQLGRITAEVNFREGPSRTARIIGRLAAGTEVDVIRQNPAGWYFVNHKGRHGFVHPSYVKLEKRPDVSRPGNSRRALTQIVGLLLVAIGAMIVVSIMAPFLFRVGLILLGCALWIVVGDIAFRLGILYSLFSALAGLMIVLLFLARKQKTKRLRTAEGPPLFKKAA